MQIVEVWADVVGFEGIYKVSNLGKVKALEKVVISGWNKVKRHYPENIMSIHYTERNYGRVKLSKNGVSHSVWLHRVIAKAFLPNPENKTDVNHIDGNPRNNKLSNLEWSTHAENIRHAVKIGLMKNTKRGNDVFGSALTEDKVKEILAIGGSMPQRKIAKKYGVNQSSVLNILKNRTWKHVDRSPFYAAS